MNLEKLQSNNWKNDLKLWNYPTMHIGLLILLTSTRCIEFLPFSSIEYVGIRTEGGQISDFSKIKAAIAATLDNNNIRSRRRLSVIYKALRVNIKCNSIVFHVKIKLFRHWMKNLIMQFHLLCHLHYQMIFSPVVQNVSRAGKFFSFYSHQMPRIFIFLSVRNVLIQRIIKRIIFRINANNYVCITKN